VLETAIEQTQLSAHRSKEQEPFRLHAYLRKLQTKILHLNELSGGNSIS
jgi:hypothetical protein